MFKKKKKKELFAIIDDREASREGGSQTAGESICGHGAGVGRCPHADRQPRFSSQTSHGSQHPQRSDRSRFPSFLRMVSSSAHQPRVLVKLLSHFNWTWLGLVDSDSGDFERLEQQLRKEMGCAGSWGAFSKRMDSQARSTQSAASTGATSPAATVIVGDGHRLHFGLLAEALQEKNVTRRPQVFSTSFLYNPSLQGPRAHTLPNGSLNLTGRSGFMPGFEDFLLALRPAANPGNHLVRKLWEELQGCRWPGSGVPPQAPEKGLSPAQDMRT